MYLPAYAPALPPKGLGHTDLQASLEAQQISKRLENTLDSWVHHWIGADHQRLV